MDETASRDCENDGWDAVVLNETMAMAMDLGHPDIPSKQSKSKHPIEHKRKTSYGDGRFSRAASRHMQAFL